MKRIITPIETQELCHYGCGQQAKFINKSNNLMCLPSSNSCPVNKKKNSTKGKEAYHTGKRKPTSELYKELPQEIKDKMNWAKGLTKETSDIIAARSAKIKQQYASGERVGSFTGCNHSQETKDILSKFRSDWLKVPDNRKNYGRAKKSWMELCFEKWLNEHNITGWTDEEHFRNEDLNKNYFVDYLFDDNLIIELDGTQHRKTIEADKIRDEYLTSLGYTVKRVQHEEFKKRYFSEIGFKDLLGR